MAKEKPTEISANSYPAGTLTLLVRGGETLVLPVIGGKEVAVITEEGRRPVRTVFHLNNEGIKLIIPARSSRNIHGFQALGIGGGGIG